VRALCLTHEHNGPAGLFADVLRERGDDLLEWNVSQGRPPEDPESFDALVVFGGSMHVDQEDKHPWLPGQHDLARKAVERGQPLMGVCLGGQLLARSVGAHVGPASRPEVGWFEVELTPEGAADPVLGSLPERFEAFEWHSYAFDVPPDGVLLARNPVCAQAFKIGDAAWGVQFHPEVTLEMLEAWRAGSEGSAPPIGLEPVGRWNELGRRLANAFFDFASPPSRRAGPNVT
jgi:GMP synthase-like glutamine amidotransferase